MLVKVGNGFDAFVKIVKWVILVRRVNGIAFEPKTHQYRLCAQHLFKGGNNWYRATAAGWNWFFAKHLAIGLVGCLVGHHFHGRYIALTTMQIGNFNFYLWWGNGFEVLLNQFGNFMVILVRHQARRNLGIGF